MVFGFARSTMTDNEFRELICENLTCRVDAKCGAASAPARHAGPA